jgi:hypothetical protein
MNPCREQRAIGDIQDNGVGKQAQETNGLEPNAEADRGRHPAFPRFNCIAGGPGCLAQAFEDGGRYAVRLIHRLVVGHFVLSAGRQFICTRPLEIDAAKRLLLAYGATKSADGQLEIGGEAVQFRDGYISFPWLSCGHNQAAERVAEALAKDQGAILAEERIAGLWGPRGGVFYPPELATDPLRQ